MTDTPETNAARRSSGLRAIADGLRISLDLSVAQKVICDAAAKIEELERDLDVAIAERDEACRTNEGLQLTFDFRWKADRRAIKRWQDATGKKLTWPDHADLVVWLLENPLITNQPTNQNE